jgi:hypothetical protein
VDLESKARSAFGDAFVDKAREVAGRVDVPFEWLLAGMGWETGSRSDPFSANLRTARNSKDGGGGLIGMPGTNPSLRKSAVGQLDDVRDYLLHQKRVQGATRFETPEDFYVLIRGPYGFRQAYSFPMGDGKNKGQVLQIYRGVMDDWGVGVAARRNEALTQLVGNWNVSIGTWNGVFAFEAGGGVWWASCHPGDSVAAIPSSQRHRGYWRVVQSRIQWGFFDNGDIRTFEKELPLGTERNQGLIFPSGQGAFQMKQYS